MELDQDLYSFYSGRVPWSVRLTKLELIGEYVALYLPNKLQCALSQRTSKGLVRDYSESGTLVFSWCTVLIWRHLISFLD